jgi:FMN reductase
MNQRTIAVVTAGLSQPSSTRLLADQLADAAVAALAPADARIVVIELRELAHDVVNHLLTGFPSPALRIALDEVRDADALIAVTPLYSGSYNGLFKSFFDVLDRDALANKPMLIAATGGSARHSLALDHSLRPLFTYLHAQVMTTGVFAATQDFGGSEVHRLTERIQRAASELAAALERTQPPAASDEYATAVPDFARLLNQH